MRSLTANILFCVSIAWAGAGGISAQSRNPDNPQTIHLEPFHGPGVSNLISFCNSQWLYPLEEPNETLISEPVYGSGKRVYYAARYGDAKDNTYTFVIDEAGGTGTGFNTLYADLNNDNRLDPDNERFPLTLSGLSIAERKNVRLLLSVRVSGKTIPYAFNFAAFRYKDRNHPIEKIHATCEESTVMVGEALFGDKRCKVALADLNSNGLFNDYEQDVFRGDRFLVDLDGNGKFEYSSNDIEEIFPHAQYSKIGGEWYTVEASPDGGTVQIRPAKPKFGVILAAGCVRSLSLSAPKQFQRIEFNNGEAQVLSGEYQVRGIMLQIIDGQAQRWNTEGRYEATGPKIAIDPNRIVTFRDVQPLRIEVAVLPASEPNAIELEPRITDRYGGVFSTLTNRGSRHQPPARLIINDADGKEIVEADLKYG
jgi:hypothetical protein